MANFTESDLPLEIKHGEMVTLTGGACVRFESNGEAKDVFLDDGYAPTVQLFPDCDYEFQNGGCKYRILARFHDGLFIEKV